MVVTSSPAPCLLQPEKTAALCSHPPPLAPEPSCALCVCGVCRTRKEGNHFCAAASAACPGYRLNKSPVSRVGSGPSVDIDQEHLVSPTLQRPRPRYLPPSAAVPHKYPHAAAAYTVVCRHPRRQLQLQQHGDPAQDPGGHHGRLHHPPAGGRADRGARPQHVLSLVIVLTIQSLVTRILGVGLLGGLLQQLGDGP